jgi:hypothetical protein
MLMLDEQHLRRVLAEDLRHYNTTRPYRPLGQRRAPAPVFRFLRGETTVRSG